MDSTNFAESEEEKLHLRYMQTRRIGEVVEHVPVVEEFDDLLRRFKEKFGFSFLEYWFDKKIGVAEGVEDGLVVRELDSVVRKMLGDKQSTDIRVRGMDAKERQMLAKDLANSIVEE